MKKLLYKLLLSIVFIFVLSTDAFCNDFRFVQVTDLHFKDNPASAELFDKIIDDINNTKNVQFVAFTGDNTDRASSSDYTKFLTMANRLNVPYYVVVGNHDVFKMGGFSKEDYVSVVRKYDKHQKTRKTSFLIKKGDIIFIVLDGAREVIPSPGGYYRDETLAWLDKKLSKYHNKKVVIFQHFPMKLRHTERDAFNNERYERLLAKHDNVIGIFSGHFHANEEYEKDGIFYSITGRASGPDAGYKIVDMIEENNPQTHKKSYSFYTQFIPVSVK